MQAYTKKTQITDFVLIWVTVQNDGSGNGWKLANFSSTKPSAQEVKDMKTKTDEFEQRKKDKIKKEQEEELQRQLEEQREREARELAESEANTLEKQKREDERRRQQEAEKVSQIYDASVASCIRLCFMHRVMHWVASCIRLCFMHRVMHTVVLHA